MLKHHRLLAAAGAVATAAAVVGAGVSAASASPAARAAASGTEHLQLISTSATSNKAAFIAHGVFVGSGTDVQGNTVDTLKFRGGGSFKVRHSAGKGPQHFNPTTCLITISQHGTYTIFGGAGRFAGISGHGKYQLSILGVGARKSNGKCASNKPPVAFQQVIHANGPVHR
jgi:hypothetical protein